MPKSKAKSSGNSGSSSSGNSSKATYADKMFPIVGIGASAGGLEAFTQFLGHLPEHAGMAFVLVQHLAPRHESALTELLSRATKLPVSEVRDGMRVERDHVYVIPPNTNLAILSGVLHLVPRKSTQQHLPIDYFFRSLAEERGSNAIGVILSGTASDGTLGMKVIKAEGGITFAQDEDSAKYADMPRNAIAAGCVDFVLPPEKIADELMRIARHPYLREPHKPESSEPAAENQLRKIFLLLRAVSGVDFSNYKQTTIKRRIKRRMVLHKTRTLKDYVSYLHENRAEIEALYLDILIHVTGFFRDPEVFDTLSKEVYPNLLKNRTAGAPVRIWVPGCSTGEEVYSIAISLLEFLGEKASNTEIQIFATDISEVALEKARVGLYLEGIATEVSPERLRRFFLKTASGYQISKSIRDMCVFARQDITKDPPFSRLDLISCRNLLIYLGSALQKKVIPILHYALKPTGYLLLGNSETIGAFADLFSLADKAHKIYTKKPAARPRLPVDFPQGEYIAERVTDGKKAAEPVTTFDVQKEVDRILLNKFAPAGVVLNDDLEIIQFRGHTGEFLEPSPGHASLSLTKMAREGLLVDIRAAVQKAKKSGAVVQKRGIQVKQNSHFREIDIEVMPIRGASPMERYYLVLFKPQAAVEPESSKASSKAAKKHVAKRWNEGRQVVQLREELAQTKASLQSIIEEQETTNEELKSANEEILSSNEELQSTNEELETAKEELQSTNEELTTLNEELQNRNSELSVANNDLINLLSSVNIPILILGNDLRIRRFTTPAEKMLNLIPTDVGRPISDLKGNLDSMHLEELATTAVDTVTIKELEVQDRQGHWYSMRIRPYKTIENKIDGAIVTWIDINTLKVHEQSALYALAIVEATPEGLLVLDSELQIKMANAAFYRYFQTSPGETLQHRILELGNGHWNIPTLRSFLEKTISKPASEQSLELDHEFPRLGRRKILFTARQMEHNGTPLVLLSMRDKVKR